MKRLITDLWKFCERFEFTLFTIEKPHHELVFYKTDSVAYGTRTEKRHQCLKPFSVLEFVNGSPTRVEWERLQKRYDRIAKIKNDA